MRVSTGKVAVEGPPLEEGATVTILGPEDAETFELGPAEEAALLAAIAEADQWRAEERSTLAALARELAEACIALQMEAAVRHCGLRIADEAITKARAAGLLPTRDSAPAEPKEEA